MIVGLQVGAMKIYAAARGKALMNNERQGETQFNTETEVPPPLIANVFLFWGRFFFLGISPYL